MERMALVSVERIESEVLAEEDKVLLSIPLESSHPDRGRQLVLVTGREREEEQHYCILGLDLLPSPNQQTNLSLGLVIKVLWGLETTLDGDGGFGIHQLGEHFMLKPVSLQLLWTVTQTLHSITARLRPRRQSLLITESDWVRRYQDNISSPQSCINCWHQMSDILSRRPPSPDILTNTVATKTVIKAKLREIMKTVNLDDITSIAIRQRLEKELDRKLNEYKMMIDEEILLILGQMDPASKIFDFMYLGSEWNASNLEELQANGVTHILNVTREIDNFFPAGFRYLNIREYDVEETDLLQYWNTTYRFCRECLQAGGVVLVHCKMGISRSASTVIAFAMKHFCWSLETALSHTASLRAVVNPNPAFRQQLVTYEGILTASRQRNSFRKPNHHRPKSKSFSSKPNLPNSLPRSPSEPSINLLDVIKENKRQRPVSWSPSTECLVGCRRVQYHCYSQLSDYISDPATSPYPAPVCSTTTNITAEKEGSEDGCPQSSLAQCTCDLELELSVSELPVDIFEVTPETEKIMKNLGSLPLHIREKQPAAAADSSLSEIHTDINNINLSVIRPEDQSDLTTPAEELSVKTLANMFDFRLSDPSMSKNLHKLIRESKLDSKYSPPIDVKTCSEC